MTDDRDAFGHALADHHAGGEVYEVIERSDGLLDVAAGIGRYFAPYEEWSALDRRSVDRARGRCLDVGCGAGRVALRLQERGLETVAIDNSPRAIEVCRARGVRDARVLPFRSLDASLGTFDTVLMMGNNFGLFGSASGMRRLLRRLLPRTRPGARIVAQTLDPSRTEDPVHLAYQEANRRRGRLPGQVRIRVRHRQFVGRWFDYLFVSPDELRSLTEGTGWGVDTIHRGEGVVYVAELTRDG